MNKNVSAYIENKMLYGSNEKCKHAIQCKVTDTGKNHTEKWVIGEEWLLYDLTICKLYKKRE